ncbi:pentapeptide repeat-containing protein [Halorubrum distributum]|uniref:Pentapeptide repeat-containing protein n=1 Tax=Halorubrum distributum JCM 10247 TaxID=1227486 RepID=M0DJV4_9EURY|nr:pentapeptide repeat-containing protein [Halorubrum terrestre]ELZ35755.1 hypothetical protein C473_03509 [Halorubrum terrestre JCM 10247]
MADYGYEIPHDPDINIEDIEQSTDLSGANLTDATIPHVDLSGADLSGANLTDATIPHVDLSGADLSAADLTGANLFRADFTNATLSGAILIEATLASAELANADLRGADLTDAQILGADFTGVKLNNADLSGADLSSADFTDTVFYLANLNNAVLRGTDFSNADLGYADLTDADLTGANLTGANLKSADLTDADLLSANLTDANLDYADLTGVSLARNTQIGAPGERIKNELSENDHISNERQHDIIARTNHELRTAYSANGLIGRARKARVRERRARRKEAFAEGGARGYTAWFGSLLSKVFTGYGVQLTWITAVIAALYLVSAGVYHFAGEMSVGRSLYYSVVTFTTSPPKTPPPGVTSVVAGIETFAGTAAIVFLGYVLGTRERV